MKVHGDGKPEFSADLDPTSSEHSLEATLPGNHRAIATDGVYGIAYQDDCSEPRQGRACSTTASPSAARTADMSIAAVHIAPCIGSGGEALRSRLDGKYHDPSLPCTAG
ncbi:hypothetical protein [Pseudomonas chlororaphis]|uniref:hypothetical protein n=1 Tax=Pseudomonas chlororaphis TaxID=587753 RepID=UPI0015DFC0DB|nr:hypothetical protein [Pseudomonas chlororaphis]QLL11502.1 hypothetical protein H0I86_21020 [Pseudomonas chlororaphis subsp. aurantiaca]